LSNLFFFSTMPDFARASFVYTRDLPLFEHERPYTVLSYMREGQKSSNLEWENGPVEQIENIRGREEDFTLDKNAFCFVQAPTDFHAWTSREKIEKEYLPEVSKLLKENIEGADLVEIFDWRRRANRQEGKSNEFTDMNDPSDPLVPASQVHLDQSPAGVLKRVKLLMGDRADSLLKGRIQLINVWRPLHIAKNWPLALCDGPSMDYDDLLEVDLVRRDYVGYTMYAKYRPGYKWCFLKDQTPDEVCLFKNFDSKDEVDGKICPHVSFSFPGDTSTRESIEVRALVLTLPKDQLAPLRK